jgi:hypothetical protein
LQTSTRAGLRILRYWLPAVLLSLVAVNQLRLAFTESVSPWSGGGFGMFAVTDSPGHRHLHVFVQNDDIRREVAFPPDLEDAVLRATTLPTRSRLQALAAELAELEANSAIQWDEIVLQVWTVDYATPGLQPGGRLVRTEHFAVAPR